MQDSLTFGDEHKRVQFETLALPCTKSIYNTALRLTHRAEDASVLVCQMYLGRVTELPAGAVRRENNGIQFYIYRMKGPTVALVRMSMNLSN